MRTLLLILLILLLALGLFGCSKWRKLKCEYLVTGPDPDTTHDLLRERMAPERTFGVQLHVHETTNRDFQLLRELHPGIIRIDLPMDYWNRLG